ncbi:MAG: FMN-binding protein [Brevinemataceae bacterium]
MNKKHNMVSFHLKNVLTLSLITGVMTFVILLLYSALYQEFDIEKEVQTMLSKNLNDGSIKKVKLILSPDILDLLNEDVRSQYSEILKKPSEIDYFELINTENSNIIRVFPVESQGHYGLVKMLVAVDDKEVYSISVVDVSDESPGLGRRALEKSFQRQFFGKTEEQIPQRKPEWKQNNLVLITGATQTSRAVAANITKAFKLYHLVNLLGASNEEK